MTDLEIFRICIAPAVFIIVLSFTLSFPKKWIFYPISIFEVILTILLLIIEMNARKVASTSGWMSFYALVLQFWIFIGLIITRIVIWLDQK